MNKLSKFRVLLRQRKFWITLGAILCVLIFLSWPLVTGHVATKKLGQKLEAIKKDLPAGGALEYTIDRGYLASNITTKLKITRGGIGSVSTSNGRLNHYSLVMQTEFKLDKLMLTQLLPTLEELTPPQLTTKFSLFGTLSNRLNIERVRYQKSDASKGLIEKILLEFCLNRDEQLSAFELSIAKIATLQGTTILSLAEKLMVDLDLGRKGHFLNPELKMTLGSLKNSEIQLSEGTMEAEGQNLNTALFKTVQARIGELSRANVKNPDANTTQQITSLLSVLLLDAPKFKINKLEMKTPEGAVNGKLELDIPQTKETGLARLFSVIKQLKFQIHFDAPETFMKILARLAKQKTSEVSGQLESAIQEAAATGEATAPNNNLTNSANQVQEITKIDVDELLKDAYEKKYLIKDDQQVSFDFEFKEGSMKLNGGPISLPI